MDVRNHLLPKKTHEVPGVSGQTALVTGAFGFLGSVLVKILAEHDYTVYALDLRDAVSADPYQLHQTPKIHTIEADILDNGLGEFFPSRIDYVFHLAALTSVRQSFEKPLRFEEVNAHGTINLLRSLEGRGVLRYVLASSAAVYGESKQNDRSRLATMKPISPYGVSKLAAEHYTRVLSAVYGFEYAILRFYNIYGPNMPSSYPGVIAGFLQSIKNGEDLLVFGTGEHKRSFLHVQDAARALLLAATASKAKEETIDICGVETKSVIEVAEFMLECLGDAKLGIRQTDADVQVAKVSSCSGDSARKLLSFEPLVPLSEGIRELIEQV